MNKYVEIITFDVGTEMPTHEYVEYLKSQNTALKDSAEQTGNTIDSQQVWVEKYKAALDVAMSENQRLTKIVEDYEAKEKRHESSSDVTL